MKKHKQAHELLDTVMEEFLSQDWVREEHVQTKIQWAVYAMSFFSLSLMNTLLLGAFYQFKKTEAPGWVLLGWFLVEAGLALFFILKTPLRKFILKSTNRIKWE